jgi:hypothetical protein
MTNGSAAPPASASWVARDTGPCTLAARRLSVAVKMTVCPPGSGTAVRPAVPAWPELVPFAALAGGSQG